ncbi:MAG: hypothetical protein HZA88_06910 [Verrucomicrobia bacterium]|nr:hypothetical protein [Verrucomicrobiota bacterium]
MDKATGKPYRHIEGTYRKETNQLRAEGRSLENPPASALPMEGGIFVPSDGGFQRLRITYVTPRDMGMHTLYLSWDPDSVPQQQSGDLPSIAEADRQLEITSSAVDPAETESGKSVTLKYEYRATQIPDTALQIEETLTITCPEGPPVETKGTCRLSDFQHGDGGRMDGAGKRERSITASKPGTYKCRIELKAAGYAASAVREVTFTVKERSKPPTPPQPPQQTTSATPGKPGQTVWVRQRTVISSGGQEGRVPSGLSGAGEAGFSYTEKSADGKSFQNSMSWSVPPQTIVEGSTVSLTLQASSNPGATVAGWWNFSDYGVWSEWKGDKLVNSFEQGVKRSGTMTFKFKPNSSDEACIGISAGHEPANRNQWCLVTWVYRKAKQGDPVATAAGNQGAPANDDTAGASTDGPPVVGPAANGEGKNNLRAWLASPIITLVPGEPSQIDGVYVSGWRNNTADRVEVFMEVVDNWGSLKVNPKIVAAPGLTSADPGNMTSGEHYFSEMWSARLGARSGTFRVPIIVRQKGAGAAAVTLTVIIPPKFTRGGGAAVANMPDARPTGGEGGNNLKARLASPTIDLVPGEPSQIDGVYVKGWRNNTADRVEVDMEVVDNWGSLKVNPKIVAAPAPTSEDPANMTSGEHYFSLMWSARLGAQPGTFYVPVTVRQKGAGFATVTLTVRILPKSTRPTGAAGISGGNAGTTAGPKPGGIIGESGKFDHVALPEFGCDMERIGGKVIVGVMTRDSVFLKAGLQPGDEIKSVNKKDVTGLPLAEIAAMLRQNRGKNVYLFVARGDKEIFSTFCRVP